MKGYKHILGYWVKQGSENLGFWTEVFQDLINIGLSKVVVFVTDNFSSLDKIIRKLFLEDTPFLFVFSILHIKYFTLPIGSFSLIFPIALVYNFLACICSKKKNK